MSRRSEYLAGPPYCEWSPCTCHWYMAFKSLTPSSGTLSHVLGFCVPRKVSFLRARSPLLLWLIKFCVSSVWQPPCPPPDFSSFQEEVKLWEGDLGLESIFLIQEKAGGKEATISYDLKGGNNFLPVSGRQGKCLPVTILFIEAAGSVLLNLITITPLSRRVEIYSQGFLSQSLLL